MTARVFVRLGVAAGILCGFVSPAGAHRLDEYLQATRVAIEASGIVLEIDLTAGAQIASRIFDAIDTNRDGRISDPEQDAYSRRVIDSLQLSVDGQPMRVTLLTREFPAFEEMAAGTGMIRLRAAVSTAYGIGRHQLTYFNAHAPDASVYLVNALVPSTGRVQMGAPHRDPRQRGLTLEFDVTPDAAWFRAGWLAGSVTLLAALGLGRRVG